MLNLNIQCKKTKNVLVSFQKITLCRCWKITKLDYTIHINTETFSWHNITSFNICNSIATIINDIKKNQSCVTRDWLLMFVCLYVLLRRWSILSLPPNSSRHVFFMELHRESTLLSIEIYSDHGRNFFGTSRISRKIKRLFISPYSSNFGVLWEAAIKSARKLMGRLIINTRMFSLIRKIVEK